LAGRDLVDPLNATIEQEQAVYEQFSAIANAKGFRPGWAAHQYKRVFGCWRIVHDRSFFGLAFILVAKNRTTLN